jgi:RHS repeat-associated protein
LTDTNGQLLSGQAYHYSPFGEAIDHPAQPEAAHLFTGEYYDSELSLYYLRARLYDPTLGRFTSCDPVEDPANKLHRYVYCGNDGVNAVDWSGENVDIGSLVSLTVLKVIANAAAQPGFISSWLVDTWMESGSGGSQRDLMYNVMGREFGVFIRNTEWTAVGVKQWLENKLVERKMP